MKIVVLAGGISPENEPDLEAIISMQCSLADTEA